jgi:hypothetical protein
MSTPLRRFLLLCALGGAAVTGTGCRHAASPPASPASVQFVDIAASAGIHFRHTSGASGRLYLADVLGSGCGMFDFDGDGRVDLFLVNSSRLPGFTEKGPFFPALYHNRGDGTFEDVTQRAGLAVDCYGMGCAVGDYDSDGHPDLYLTAWGKNRLFRNNGDGTFTDVTGRAGVGGAAGKWSTSAAWLDYDRDGKLDLFVCNYVDWSPKTNRVCKDGLGHSITCLPRDYPGQSCTLYRNLGDGRFRDVTRQAGMDNTIGKSLGVVTWDANGDGWPDLYIANDGVRNLFYLNQGNGRFTESAIPAGVAFGTTGGARAGMGADSADYGNDGAEAIAVGDFSQEGLGLFRPEGKAMYRDVSADAGLFEPSLTSVSFGMQFCDYDLDGRKDLIVANGHVQQSTEYVGEGITYEQRPLLFHNEGAGQFQEVAAQSGPGLQYRALGRGLAAGDIDGDGDPDFLINNCNRAPVLLRNDGGSRNHWLAVRAVGTRSNRSGIGAHVVVTTGSTRQQGWIRSGSSYGSASDLTALFGLGSAASADSVTLNWPSGVVQSLHGVKANQVLVVTEAGEGSSRAMSSKLHQLRGSGGPYIKKR